MMAQSGQVPGDRPEEPALSYLVCNVSLYYGGVAVDRRKVAQTLPEG